jgi:hypothetical protein
MLKSNYDALKHQDSGSRRALSPPARSSHLPGKGASMSFDTMRAHFCRFNAVALMMLIVIASFNAAPVLAVRSLPERRLLQGASSPAAVAIQVPFATVVIQPDGSTQVLAPGTVVDAAANGTTQVLAPGTTTPRGAPVSSGRRLESLGVRFPGGTVNVDSQGIKVTAPMTAVTVAAPPHAGAARCEDVQGANDTCGGTRGNAVNVTAPETVVDVAASG